MDTREKKLIGNSNPDRLSGRTSQHTTKVTLFAEILHCSTE